MPYTVAKRNRLFRLLGPDGRLAKTARGRAVDGGGHATRQGARAQARAIMANEGRR